MFTKSKVVLTLAALSLISATSFADKDLVTLVKEGSTSAYDHAVEAKDNVRDHLQPIPGWMAKKMKDAKDGTILAAGKIKDGVVSTGTFAYKRGDEVVTGVIDPVLASTIQALVATIEIPTRDIAFEFGYKTVDATVKGADQKDLANGFEKGGQAIGAASDYLADDMNANYQTVKDKTESAGTATFRFGSKIYRRTIKTICEPLGCNSTISL